MTTRNPTVPDERNVSKTAVLYRMVMEKQVCPYGLKAKDLLERKGFTVEDHWLKTREQTDNFQREQNVEATPQVYIGGTRIGGYDELRQYFGQEVKGEDATSYQPVIAIFSVTLLMAIGFSWAAYGSIFTVRAAEWFIAISMCILGIQKLQVPVSAAAATSRWDSFRLPRMS